MSSCLVNPASNPVQTQNVGGGAATQVGQPVSKVVNLVCFMNNGANVCALNGFAPQYVVPAGEALVITDAQWFSFSPLPQGSYDGVIIQQTGSDYALSLSSLVDSNETVAGQARLATGVVVPPGNAPVALQRSGFLRGNVWLQGYLVPNR